jgi:hypothetical protein
MVGERMEPQSQGPRRSGPSCGGSCWAAAGGGDESGNAALHRQRCGKTGTPRLCRGRRPGMRWHAIGFRAAPRLPAPLFPILDACDHAGEFGN